MRDLVGEFRCSYLKYRCLPIAWTWRVFVRMLRGICVCLCVLFCVNLQLFVPINNLLTIRVKHALSLLRVILIKYLLMIFPKYFVLLLLCIVCCGWWILVLITK